MLWCFCGGSPTKFLDCPLFFAGRGSTPSLPKLARVGGMLSLPASRRVRGCSNSRLPVWLFGGEPYKFTLSRLHFFELNLGSFERWEYCLGRQPPPNSSAKGYGLSNVAEYSPSEWVDSSRPFPPERWCRL